MIDYTDLKRTEIDLYDVAVMNEALEVRDENTRRAREAMERTRGK